MPTASVPSTFHLHVVDEETLVRIEAEAFGGDGVGTPIGLADTIRDGACPIRTAPDRGSGPPNPGC